MTFFNTSRFECAKIELFTLIQFDSNWTLKAFLIIFSSPALTLNSLSHIRKRERERKMREFFISKIIQLDVKVTTDDFTNLSFFVLLCLLMVFITHSTNNCNLFDISLSPLLLRMNLAHYPYFFFLHRQTVTITRFISYLRCLSLAHI